MSSDMVDAIRATMLEVITDCIKREPGFGASLVVKLTVDRLRARGLKVPDIDVIDSFYGLFRSGFLSWGLDQANLGMNWAHVTAQGRRSLALQQRAPENPDGYLAWVVGDFAADSVAEGYLKESLRTYNAGCHRAAAVMVGCAAEAMVHDLRDAFLARFSELGKDPPKGLHDQRIKVVRDGIAREVSARKDAMTHKLRERFDVHWPLSDQLRMTRNDAGHPTNIQPVSEEAAHAALLIFPLFSSLVHDLTDWVATALA